MHRFLILKHGVTLLGLLESETQCGSDWDQKHACLWSMDAGRVNSRKTPTKVTGQRSAKKQQLSDRWPD